MNSSHHQKGPIMQIINIEDFANLFESLTGIEQSEQANLIVTTATHATLGAAGDTITAIAEKVGVSVSTTKRYATQIPNGAANEELIDQARQDPLSRLSDENEKTHLSALIADDLALSQRLRARVASVYSNRLTGWSPQRPRRPDSSQECLPPPQQL
jgi:alkaline phosphatase